MKIHSFSVLILGSLLAACSGNSETTTSNETESHTVNSDSVISETENTLTYDVLPATECIEITDDAYIIDNMLAHIQSESTPGQNLSVVMSEDENLYLEIGYDKTGLDESWKITLNIDSPFGLDVKLEFADVNQDDLKDELVIWWSKSDGNNGINSGYESAQSGVIIFDVMQRTEILNFIFSNEYSTYSAGENANTNDPDFHAKMADDTDWFICSYSHDVKLVDGEIQISNYYKQTEGIGECYLTEYAEGTYQFSISEGLFKLKN